MTPLRLSTFLALPFVVQRATALRVGALEQSRAGGRGPEWVDEIIRMKARSDWWTRTRECAREVETLAMLHAPPKVKPIAIQGPLDEFSDLSPAEIAWVEEQYNTQKGEVFALTQQPNTTDQTTPSAHEGGDAQEFPLTTGECKQAYGGGGALQTCLLRNVYVVNGALVAHVLDDTLPTAALVHTKSGAGGRPLATKVTVFKHASKSAFQAHMGSTTHTRFAGTTLAFEPTWHFNIGHALYDGLYPAFVSLMQWGMDQTPFRVLKLGPRNDPRVEARIPGAYARNEEVYGLIGGKGIVSQHALNESHAFFEALVIGMGRNGQKLDLNGNFSLGGGRELGAARLFRSHAYTSLGIPVRDKQPRLLEGIIIRNRRWDGHDWVGPLQRLAAAASVKLEYIDWANAHDTVRIFGGEGKNPSPTSGQFRGQLLLISRTYIHISSPGTGMMYQQFLPDGAVHINLGESPDGLPRQFMEEHMAEGAPHIRALYYWPAKGAPPQYDAGRIMELVGQAKGLVEEGFEIPVPVNTNLSPTLRVVKAFVHLTQDEDKLRSQTPLRRMGSSPFSRSYNVDYFENHYVHELLRGPIDYRAGPQHWQIGPGLNPCMLRALTRDYGEPCAKCEWGFP